MLADADIQALPLHRRQTIGVLIWSPSPPAWDRLRLFVLGYPQSDRPGRIRIFSIR